VGFLFPLFFTLGDLTSKSSEVTGTEQPFGGGTPLEKE
jgi:hypothetical protein